VELPPDIFNDLDEAAVEAWVRWDDFAGAEKRLFNYGGALGDMSLFADHDTAQLRFVVADPSGKLADLHWINVDDILRPRQWCHVAGVSGKGGMKLYFNGALVGANAYAGSFSGFKHGARNYLGQTVTTNDSPTRFKGTMDEFRVWNRARSETEINADMFTRLTGMEPGLVGLWNFDNVENGVVKDARAGAHQGRLMGNARTIEAQLPAPSALAKPSVIFGSIKDEADKPMPNASIRILRQDLDIATTWLRPDGTYSLALRPEQAEGMFDLQTSAGDLGAWASGVACSRGERKEVNFTLARSVSIVGKVADFDGLSIQDVIVQAVRANAPPRQAGRLATPGLAATTLTTTTNGATGYRFVNLRPGEYKVRIHVPEGQLEYHRGEVVRVAPGQTRVADFQTAPFRKGIARYEGERLDYLAAAESAIDRLVLAIHATPEGILWLGDAEGGVTRFDPHRFTFTRLGGEKSAPSSGVMKIKSGPDGALWFASDSGLFRYDGVTWSTLDEVDGLPSLALATITQGRDGAYWIGTDKGVTCYRPARQEPRPPRKARRRRV